MASDHYIPLRPADLIRKLADEPAVTIFEREQFLELCQIAQATIHHEYRAHLASLQASYAPFDPDQDATVLFPATAAEARQASNRLFDEFDKLLERANYQKLSHDQIAAALRSPSHTGLRLKLDLRLFERLEVYVRGRCELTEKRKGFLRTGPREAKIPAYRRLAIIFRLQAATPLTDPLDTRAVVLKLFKDIPHQDVETLLPGARVCMGLFEQARIIVPTVSGLALTLFKLAKGAAALAVAEFYSLAAMLGLISGAIGYGAKSFHGYLRTREKHQLSLTRHLYFQNLDNNAGVIYHLLAEAEEQEFRELILAWWLLWRGGLCAPTAQQLDAAAERWLTDKCGIQADFEVDDALAKLHRLNLAFPLSAGRWRAVTIDQALDTLDRAWHSQFTRGKPASQPSPAGLRIRRAA